MLAVFCLFIFLSQSKAVIYRLTESEYAQMPPLTHMDHFDECKRDTNALYCMSEYVLVSEKPNPLLEMIQEFSAHATHFNHSKIYYGICVTESCQKFYESEQDLRRSLEACLNESMSEKYDLKVKLQGDPHCFKPGTTGREIDQLDITVGIICSILLIINVVGSLYLYYFYNENKAENAVIRFLLCFSLIHNWKKLTTTSQLTKDPRLVSLNSLHGIRVISVCLVIVAHSLLTVVAVAENPQFLEEAYLTRPYYILLNGTLIMQTFLITSSFLLTFNLLRQLEEHDLSWYIFPKYIGLRWLRLTPQYIVALALTATWFSKLSSGPLWSKLVGVETDDCRQYWWRNLLYINNYLENSQCMVQSWYLAADTQLYCLALVICVACRTTRSLIITLSLLFAAGMVIPATHVYFQDLDGIQLCLPETIMHFFFNDPHFKYVYSKGHTNIVGYVIGMTTGYLVYYWQKQKIDFRKYQTPLYRLFYWSLFLLGLYCCYIGGIFYEEAPRKPLYVRVLFAALLKPIFGLIIAVLMVGFIFKFEDLYRGVLDWRGWRIGSQLTYSAYLMHVMIVRNHVASQTSLNEAGVLLAIQNCANFIAASFAVALVFWLLVEAPLSNVMKEYILKLHPQQVTKKLK